MKLIRLWLNDRSGVALVEYGLIVAAIALAVVVGLGSMGNGISSALQLAGTKIAQNSK